MTFLVQRWMGAGGGKRAEKVFMYCLWLFAVSKGCLSILLQAKWKTNGKEIKHRGDSRAPRPRAGRGILNNSQTMEMESLECGYKM